MSRDELCRKSLFNTQYRDYYLHNEYDKYIQKEYMRIVGKEIQQETIDTVLSSVCTRLPEIPMDCDIQILVFDCLRKEILGKVRKCALSVNSTVLKEVHLDITGGNSAFLLEAVLPLLTKKQLRYFWDKYYYFHEVNFNRHHERAISGLFRGKGLAAARFRFLKLLPCRTDPVPYVWYLEHLDFSHMEFLHDGTVVILSDRILHMPVLCKLWERQYRITKYMLCVLAVMGLVFGVIAGFLH